MDVILSVSQMKPDKKSRLTCKLGVVIAYCLNHVKVHERDIVPMSGLRTPSRTGQAMFRLRLKGSALAWLNAK